MANRSRKSEESYEQYKINLNREEAMIKQTLKGKNLWIGIDSMWGISGKGTYVREKHGELK